MATPATTRTVRPLDTLRFTPPGNDATGHGTSAPPQITSVVAEHLRLLGARADGAPRGRPSDGRITLHGGGFEPAGARVAWADPASGIVDEATVQAATGIMAVHGRRDGSPRGLGTDYAATATAVLTVQGLLAGLIGQARGLAPAQVATSADRAGLLTVAQYIAAAGADEEEAAETAAGGPPFTSAEGILFELETLDPGAWAAFWRALEAPAEAIRAGWRPFQFRYATACAPFPQVLHTVTRSCPLERIRQAAARADAEVCVLRTLAERAAEDDGAAPWSFRPIGPGPGETSPGAGDGTRRMAAYTDRTVRDALLGTRHALLTAPNAPRVARDARPRATARATGPARPGALPLAGLTVLEAGRRIQAPLAAHLLGLLGAEVIRIEPPGGDPLRGMPPTCSGTSARWLALNRGKQAVEIDIKSEADRRRLRGMAAGADVFLHNWAPGKAAQLGLDHADLAAVNPSLVYAYTGGWGGRLPDAPMGTDFMVQARTGVGEAVRPAGEPPAPSLMTLLDVLGGLHGTEAVLAGLLLALRTGHGVRVDSSLLGAADTLTGPALRRAARGQDPRPPAGYRYPLATADGWIAPSDACAAAAAAYDLRELPTAAALSQLRDHGLAATAVTTDLSALHHDARFAGSISRDAHGAPAVPDPWSFR
ncbi:acyl-CoA transferase [Streptomyces sp. CB00455]|uniref:CoA transferase n=1 Tax=Streptomyces sp. CB00455 TaxID=1703927 RepID=UPI00093B1B3C|nr:CoA transferase [Streptomyces sp. CB00455]OKK22263.1 acyl-CoA transferase [Streptomyces sp. CB00455]